LFIITNYVGNQHLTVETETKGGFDTREEAEAAKARLKADGMIDPQVIEIERYPTAEAYMAAVDAKVRKRLVQSFSARDCRALGISKKQEVV